VETADGIMKGTKTIEEMAIAAQEVSASTTQLVAAARVKGFISHYLVFCCFVVAAIRLFAFSLQNQNQRAKTRVTHH